MYKEKSIKKYLDDLASKAPAPGGGSAAALEGALGCALMSMTANFTISNKRYADVKDKAKTTLKKSEALRSNLIKLIDKDVTSYTKLSQTFKKGKKDTSNLEKLYKAACDVPYNIAKLTYRGMTICRELVEFGNKNLITDTAIAACMFESAFFGAKFNVYINLKYINDKAYIENIHNEISGYEMNISKLKEEVLHKSEEVIM